MRNTENVILQELNKLNDEIFRLYYSGYHKEAINEANNLLSIAKNKLGQQHPSLSIFHDNLKYIRTQPVENWRSNRVNMQLTEKKDRIDGIKRELRFTEISEGDVTLSAEAGTPYQNRKLISILFGLALITQVVLITFYFQFKDIYLNRYQEYNPSAMLNMEEINQVENFIIPELREKVILEAPLILQYPELPRGCEVTSLAMLLQYAGIDIDKMTLAAEVKKDPTPYQLKNGKVFFGNPYNGYVGDMYTLQRPGLGVYYGPILELAETYMENRVVNLTGGSFDDLYYFINKDIPVWIITNSRYKKLGDNHFQTWETPTGPIRITYRLHSVLVTGYDDNYIYFNDPLVNSKNRKIKKEDFEDAWVQMGRQAISYLPEGKTLDMILPNDNR
ncbi:C39 family peptidase [Alkaliphilus peptidifermentans]|uniref:Uncharacterized protein YvpB n=1 Tax=Alkaliphilus peptidifermentans DSM 18978 TaxID=1120976 RepID=A0A1G5FFS2_9FIRM|nr:C39 family peptidase [Alkaliphilus peptidifermentans]SCY38142.1 Uncharacterized protein YvpB [Alkaliphilus peptidifermentans DSM 18978]